MPSLSSNTPAFNGSIELILGPMFSGKTTELFRRIRRYTFANYRCIVIKYRKDQRYAAAGEASTHDQLMLAAHPCERLSEAIDQVKDFDVIGIDEGQFFPDLPEYSEKWANAGKVIVVSALDGTFQRKPFGRTLELIPLAEKIDKLHAVCMLCFGDASFSKRISTTDNRVEVIGGSEAYVSTCRKCYLSSRTRSIRPLKHPGLFSPRLRSKRARSRSSSEASSTSVTESDASTTPTSSPETSPKSTPITHPPAPAPASEHGHSSSAAVDKENFSLRSVNDMALPSPTTTATFKSGGRESAESRSLMRAGVHAKTSKNVRKGAEEGVLTNVTSQKESAKVGQW